VIRFLLVLLLGLGTFQLLGDPSYDCHTYAWETRDHSQFPPRPAKEVDCGEIVVYFSGSEPIHSGKYLGYGLVLSKWGKNPVVLHPIWFSSYGFSWRFYELEES